MQSAIAKPSDSEAANERQGFGYDWQGEKTSFVDQNGTNHYLFVDQLGRPYGDRTGILGSGVDGSVTTLETAGYDDAGRLFRQTSINNNTHSDVNQTEYLYNGYGQLTTIYERTDRGGPGLASG